MDETAKSIDSLNTTLYKISLSLEKIEKHLDSIDDRLDEIIAYDYHGENGAIRVVTYDSRL